MLNRKTGIMRLILAAILPLAAAGWQEEEEPAAVTIDYIAHASFQITSQKGVRIVIDPYADKVWLGYDYPKNIETDAVLITHPHYDHDGGEYMGRSLPFPSEPRIFRHPGQFQLEDVRLTGFQGRHAEPYGREFGRFNTVWAVETGAIRIVHWGDNEPVSDALADQLGAVDILMLPIDGEEHLLTFDAVSAILKRLRPRIVIPIHYRIPELEPGDGPDDLGEIAPWLNIYDGLVIQKSDHRAIFSAIDLPEPSEQPVIVIFQPSPEI